MVFNDQSHPTLMDSQDSSYDIILAMENEALLVSPELVVLAINPAAEKLLQLKVGDNISNCSIQAFLNLKKTLSFDIHSWLQESITNQVSDDNESFIWLKQAYQIEATPYRIRSKVIFDHHQQPQKILITLHNAISQQRNEQQNRIFEASFNNLNGQMIANKHGFIINPNTSFIALTGLFRDQLCKMTILDWLQQQVETKVEHHEILQTLLKNRYWSGEAVLKPTAKINFQVILTITLIVDGEHNIEHYIASIQNITDEREAQNKLKKMAFYDPVTQLANRALIIEHIGRAIEDQKRYYTHSALLYINLERFRRINDSFDHMIGDELLKQTGQILKETLREGDIIARIKADEFAVLTQDRANNLEKACQNAKLLAEKISSALNHQYEIDNLTLESRCRIGIATFPTEDINSEQLLLNADLAARQAKSLSTEHKITSYQKFLLEEIEERRVLELELSKPEIFDQLELYYQAQIGEDKQLHGAETLIRWIHPQHGFIRPDKFIAIAEESHQIVKIGNWIMKNAFLQAKKWAKKHPHINISVNISPVQFHEADFIEQTVSLLEQTGANATNLTLELTEGILIADIDEAVAKIKQLNNTGFKVSIDDFGTGYSSLSYLQKLHIHELKIDRSFIFRLPDNQDDIAIVQSILQLAQAKQLLIVAEGVETELQVDFLRQQDPNILIQGYVYSKPCPAKEFQQTFLSSKENALDSLS